MFLNLPTFATPLAPAESLTYLTMFISVFLLTFQNVYYTWGDGIRFITLPISYTPANPADWVDPDPTTVQEALDRIAAFIGPIP
ncbi:hypothetical protein [Paenibacillus sedimenti]|uniref:Uncharacterized protein n=1 Tax=Paenibacillus sedimenti TaxID=2770274 RepID=A0A926KV94_9BACL|nr:hypothetical protein [Paenibacillus sedimenti]MBD0384660.1 hypothetical protein [Paenibacillus sedimenti]